MRFAFLTALGLCLLPTIPAQEKPKSASVSALDKTQLEAYVRHLLAVIPEVQVKIDDPKPGPSADLLQVDVHFTYQGRSQDETFYVTKDGQHIIRGVVYNFAENPFKEDLDKLKTAGSPSFGPATAPVTMVEFGDFECPNCKGKRKHCAITCLRNFRPRCALFSRIFRWSRSIPGPRRRPSPADASFSRAPQHFWKFHDWIYDHQTEITTENLKTQVLDFAKGAPDLDSLQLGRCIDSKATEPAVEASIAEAHSLHVDATPTVFVNGRRLVGNYPWQNLDQIINGELNFAKSAQNPPPAADDKCCEIKIPSPLNK